MEIELKNKIEAILFLTSEKVFISDLAKNLRATSEECLIELKKIEINYVENDSALRLVFKKNQVQLVTNPKLSLFLKTYFKKEKSEQLSLAMLEVLSIIAYKGPISKAQIEYIRGVNCSLILRKLAIKGFVEKKEQIENSRIFLYETSLQFLKKMGILRLEDLPSYDKLTKELMSEKIV